MPAKTIDGYEVEFTAEPLEGCGLWGAYVSIYAPSDNPMHLNSIYPKQRVAADVALDSEAAAQTAAEQAAMDILQQLRSS
jgi:hypothetical protein